MARGYSGAFGHKLNAPYVFLPLCAIFLLGLVDWRRLRRIANLDLLVLLGFGVSNFFFNRAEIGVSVPLQYIPLAYLFGRALWIGLRGGGEGIRPRLAGRLAAGRGPLPDRLPGRPQHGRLGRDRRRLRGRGRRRSDRPRRTDLRQLPRRRLPGRHLRPGQLPRLRPLRADLALVGNLERPPRGPRRRRLLRPRHLRPADLPRPPHPPRAPPATSSPRPSPSAGPPTPTPPSPCSPTPTTRWWRCCLVATLLVLAKPAARGVMAALATFAKFAPAVLVPMLATYRPAGPVAAGDPPPPAVAKASSGAGPPTAPPAGVAFVIAFALTAFALLLWPAIDPGLHTVYDRTIAYQAGRDSPFSIWGQVPSLEPLRVAILDRQSPPSLCSSPSAPRRSSSSK